MRPGAYNQESIIEFLEDLHAHLGRDKVTLIWDGLPSHRSKVMKDWIATQRHWLVVEQLPAYGHDLNPVELIWGNLKASELANLCPDTIEEAAVLRRRGTRPHRQRRRTVLRLLAPLRPQAMTTLSLYYTKLFKRIPDVTLMPTQRGTDG